MSELRFPFPEAPEPGASISVAEGIRWLRMPLPLALDHINLYLLADGDHWWIVDTGMGGKDTQKHWDTLFASEFPDIQVAGVIVTHMHPDHVGQSGWLCDRFRVPLYMSAGEYFNARVLAKAEASDLGWTNEAYYRSTGLGEDFFQNFKRGFAGFRQVVEPIPSSFQRLRDGDTLEINGEQWQVVMGSGHSYEHACLFNAERKILLSGDQLIAGISSNVSVTALEPEGNPLADWLASLDRLAELPSDTLVLASHKLPFYGLRERATELKEHHHIHLEQLMAACANTANSAMDLLPVLFKRQLPEHSIPMAIGECVAHLHYLMNEGRMERIVGEDGVHYYKALEFVDASAIGDTEDELPFNV